MFSLLATCIRGLVEPSSLHATPLMKSCK